jgi:hypothetical protein
VHVVSCQLEWRNLRQNSILNLGNLRATRLRGACPVVYLHVFKASEHDSDLHLSCLNPIVGTSLLILYHWPTYIECGAIPFGDNIRYHYRRLCWALASARRGDHLFSFFHHHCQLGSFAETLCSRTPPAIRIVSCLTPMGAILCGSSVKNAITCRRAANGDL